VEPGVPPHRALRLEAVASSTVSTRRTRTYGAPVHEDVADIRPVAVNTRRATSNVVDESGDDEAWAGISDLGVRRWLERGLDCLNPGSFDEDVGPLEAGRHCFENVLTADN
jgi:hypothetical protein